MLTADEIADRRRVTAEHAAQEAVALVPTHAEAAECAAAIWNDALPADDTHPYLTRKGVRAYGLRLHKGALGFRYATPKVCCTRCNHRRGRDETLLDRRASLGLPFQYRQAERGAVHRRGLRDRRQYLRGDRGPVEIGFNAGNLGPTAQALYAQYPDLRIVVCADDDYRTAGNPVSRRQPRRRVRLANCWPCPTSARNGPRSDHFNDLLQHRGVEAVKACDRKRAAPAVAGDQVETPAGTAAPTSAAGGTVAQAVIEIGARCDLFHDERGDGYA